MTYPPIPRLISYPLAGQVYLITRKHTDMTLGREPKPANRRAYGIPRLLFSELFLHVGVTFRQIAVVGASCGCRRNAALSLSR